MPEPVYFLTENDRQRLSQMLEMFEAQFKNTGRARILEDDHQAPETYVVLIPVAGIPARDGTTPGSATCTICAIRDVSGVDTLDALTLALTVYNVADVEVDGGDGYEEVYGVATRDKFGKWLITSVFQGETGTGGDETAFGPPCVIRSSAGVVVGIAQRYYNPATDTYRCVVAEDCECGGTGTEYGGTAYSEGCCPPLWFCTTDDGWVMVEPDENGDYVPPVDWDGSEPHTSEEDAEAACPTPVATVVTDCGTYPETLYATIEIPDCGGEWTIPLNFNGTASNDWQGSQVFGIPCCAAVPTEPFQVSVICITGTTWDATAGAPTQEILPLTVTTVSTDPLIVTITGDYYCSGVLVGPITITFTETAP